MSSAICFNLDQCKILSSGNGLTSQCIFSAETDLNLHMCKCIYLYHTILTLNDPGKKKNPLQNNVGKGENEGNQQFLPVPTIFSDLPKTNSNFWVTFKLSSATLMLSILECLKFCHVIKS